MSKFVKFVCQDNELQLTDHQVKILCRVSDFFKVMFSDRWLSTDIHLPEICVSDVKELLDVINNRGICGTKKYNVKLEFLARYLGVNGILKMVSTTVTDLFVLTDTDYNIRTCELAFLQTGLGSGIECISDFHWYNPHSKDSKDSNLKVKPSLKGGKKARMYVEKVDGCDYYTCGKPKCSFDICKDISEFRDTFKDILDIIPFELYPGKIIIAGGSVLAAITGCEYNDIDVFFVDCTPEEATEIIIEVSKRYEEKHGKTFYMRTSNAITMYPTRDNTFFKTKPLQFILRIRPSIAHIIANFDIDSCCCAYDGTNVWAMPRFIRSVNCGYNIADPIRYTKSYANRLVKYVSRGFAIALPGYIKSRDKTNIRNIGLSEVINTFKTGITDGFINNYGELVSSKTPDIVDRVFFDIDKIVADKAFSLKISDTILGSCKEFIEMYISQVDHILRWSDNCRQYGTVFETSVMCFGTVIDKILHGQSYIDDEYIMHTQTIHKSTKVLRNFISLTKFTIGIVEFNMSDKYPTEYDNWYDMYKHSKNEKCAYKTP